MHTKRYRADKIGEVHVIVNSDWSGNAEVHWGMDGGPVTLPGRVLLAIAIAEGKNYVLGQIAKALDIEL